MTNVADINARLKSIRISGKEYVTVSQRVLGFRELFPEGSIVTEFTRVDKDWCMCKASVIVDGFCLATGHAHEERKGRFADAFIEVCETSAVGRALGLVGIGSVESIASADEMKAAEARAEAAQSQSATKKPAAATNTALQEMRDAYKAMKAAGKDPDEVLFRITDELGKPVDKFTTANHAYAAKKLQEALND